MEMDFTHRAYLELLAHIRGLGYSIGPFRDVLDAERFVVLRHDIDFSLEKGRQMAELDRQAGVHSTFFILLTSMYFNVLSEQGVAHVRAIAEMGHEIGLHIDLTGFEGLSPDQQQDKIGRLAAVLRDICGQEVGCIAQHRPASTLVRVSCPGFVDAYEDRFFEDIGYISDSRRVFVKPDVYGFFNRHERSQLLTHPIWWTAEPTTRAAILAEFGADLADSIRQAVSAEDARIEARIRAAQSG